jgi:hypothetical protein
VDVSSVPRGVHAERERAAGGVHGHVANAAVEPGEVRGIGPERGHVTFQRAAASRALPPAALREHRRRGGAACRGRRRP